MSVVSNAELVETNNEPMPAGFRSTTEAFAARGETMRAHRGRSVVRIDRDGRNYYLKRYWLDKSQLFKRHVARGFHELRMIDWLNDNGFLGPRVAARGHSRVCFLTTRLYFLMEEVADEVPLEQAWWRHPEDCDTLLDQLASLAASLHDRGFIHTDFSERHIFVGRTGGGWTFRLIDVERAKIGAHDAQSAAADLKTLAASAADATLRESLGARFLDAYITKRRTLAPGTDMRSLFARARPTRSF